MTNTSHYEILQIQPDASDIIIKAAYKTLSAKYHPDRDPSFEGTAKFKQITEAFNILSDPASRMAYDETLRSGTPELTPFDYQILIVYKRSGKIAALKMYRQAHGTGFKEAKTYLDRLLSAHNVPSSAIGCLLIFIVLTTSASVLCALILMINGYIIFA
ncbi:J domain-containing protein [Gimesia aquarii]|uniref:Chaperone protein DnaJ n=1 Tax=Gimesia aquarii TaxID=2527964 RepID=A0A517X196_9PLAN|nr:J domain-containing protein [Gimesia aquarii]QDU11278.1 Chaperone protein DnaJ [Gimesia aquarii]